MLRSAVRLDGGPQPPECWTAQDLPRCSATFSIRATPSFHVGVIPGFLPVHHLDGSWPAGFFDRAHQVRLVLRQTIVSRQGTPVALSLFAVIGGPSSVSPPSSTGIPSVCSTSIPSKSPPTLPLPRRLLGLIALLPQTGTLLALPRSCPSTFVRVYVLAPNLASVPPCSCSGAPLPQQWLVAVAPTTSWCGTLSLSAVR